MKIGVFADIHGNIYAFDKILKSLKAEVTDLNIFCGDICGYYYYQNEIIDILREMNSLICVAGNHDRMFLAMLESNALEEEYSRLYGRSAILLKKSIKKKNLQFIESLPDKYIFDNYHIAVFHGSPWDKLNGYVYPTDSLDRFEELPYAYILLGHTHYPMDRCIKHIRVVNPGSCGQPRDCNEPSYAILDLSQKTVELKRLRYNTDLMIRDVLRHEESNSYLTAVLKRTETGCE